MNIQNTCVLNSHAFQLNFNFCASLWPCFPQLLCNGPFWGRYDSYWGDSMMMAPVLCRNIMEIC